jgi:hypothetical protein
LVYGLLSGHWAALVWSLLVLLSYSHYSDGGFEEQPLLIIIEYSLLFLALGFEYYINSLSKKDYIV